MEIHTLAAISAGTTQYCWKFAYGFLKKPWKKLCDANKHQDPADVIAYNPIG